MSHFRIELYKLIQTTSPETLGQYPEFEVGEDEDEDSLSSLSSLSSQDNDDSEGITNGNEEKGSQII